MKGHIAHCQFAVPTLRLEWPLWLDAWSWPWTCTQADHIRLVSDTERCHECAHWHPRTTPTVDAPAVARDSTIERD